MPNTGSSRLTSNSNDSASRLPSNGGYGLPYSDNPTCAELPGSDNPCNANTALSPPAVSPLTRASSSGYSSPDHMTSCTNHINDTERDRGGNHQVLNERCQQGTTSKTENNNQGQSPSIIVFNLHICFNKQSNFTKMGIKFNL